MPTIFAHAVSAVALASHYKRSERPSRFWILAIVCSILPDIDVIGLKFGIIKYGDLFGHRGFSHSLLFAFIVGLLVVLSAFRSIPRFSRQWFSMVLFFFLAWSINDGWPEWVQGFFIRCFYIGQKVFLPVF